MKKVLLGTALVSAAFAASIGSGSAATLEEVTARLERVERENTLMRQQLKRRDVSKRASTVESAAAPSSTRNPMDAMAADLGARPYAKAPPISNRFDWSGFYVGANGGYGTSDNSWELVGFNNAPISPAIAQGRHDATGGVAGGQIGRRWQLDNIVFGIEAQGNWADLNGSNIQPTNAATTDRSRIDAFGLFTGQIGYAWTNNLLYVKGGAAVTSSRFSQSANVDIFPIAAGTVFASSKQETRWGAVAGVGYEYGFGPNWSVALEYDHLFMADKNIDLLFIPVVPATFTTHRIRQDVDILTVRVNYRLNDPIVARY